MTFLMFLSKRALLPQWKGLLRLGDSAARRCEKSSIFSVGARGGGSAICTGRGLGKGGGVLLTRATASFLVEDTTFTMMEIAPSCGVIYGI